MKLSFTRTADMHLKELEAEPGKARILKDVRKTLALMEINLRHPSLNTHEFRGYAGPNNEKIFEAYAQSNTPGAYRIFWYYGPQRNTLTIIAIIQHPD